MEGRGVNGQFESKPMIGKQFGEWTVQEFSHVLKYGKRARIERFWKCKCSCGKFGIVNGYTLRNGRSTRCRECSIELLCLRTTKHRHYGTPTYSSWGSMMARGARPSKQHFKYYGARGISVCERWRNFENFLADMGERPPGKTLDRIDVDKGYYKENCRWATPYEQRMNSRGCIICNCRCRIERLKNEHRSTDHTQSLQTTAISITSF